jgi:transcriptional regulator with XRE-family HTH domain
MKEERPQAVKNLRKIWEIKKVEMQFTQVEAAKELGWSQGAISHYLNNITDLGPAATIKFANFLGVDPLEIDSDITEFLPNVRTRILKYDVQDLTKVVNTKIYDANPASAFWVKIYPTSFAHLDEYLTDSTQFKNYVDAEWLTKVCPVKDFPKAKAFLVQLKGEKSARIYRGNNLPPADRMSKKYAVLETEISHSLTSQ